MAVRTLFKVEDTEFETLVELEAVPRTGETVFFGGRAGSELDVRVGEVLEVTWNVGARELADETRPDIEILVRIRQ